MTRNSSLDGWSNSVWNQVFCGDPGAPGAELRRQLRRQRRPEFLHDAGHLPATRGGAVPVHRLRSGNYQVFVPVAADQLSGPTWTATSNTPGTSLPLNTFYVVQPSASTVATINAALAAGDNLLFTPGVYNITQTHQRDEGRHEDHRPRLPDADPDRRQHHDERGRRRRRQRLRD